MADQPLRLDQEDLYSPRVEAYLEERDALRRGLPDITPTPLVLRIIRSSWFYLSLAGTIGALAAWAILEPFIDDGQMGGRGFPPLPYVLLFPMVAGFVGMFLGAVEGLMCRNLQRALLSGAVGLGIGFGGGVASWFIGEKLYQIVALIAVEIWKNQNPVPGQKPGGLVLLVLIMGRSAGWAVIAIPAGLGQGIALKEKKVILNGLLGAILGGLVGGLLFDPIALAFPPVDGKATLSRAVGFGCVGLFVGLFVGLVEQWTKTAWLMMKAGPLAGKQFVIYRNPTVLGSSPKADIYLFKDGAIEPRHALIHNRGGRFEIEDCETPDGTYVNGVAIRRHILQPGDQIVLGQTVLEFSLREAK